MRKFPRPIVVVSRCLGLAACRYNGEIIPFGFIQSLARFAKIVPVCPEEEIGLGTPREPVRLVESGGGRLRLVQPATRRRLTREMRAYSREFLRALPAADGFILKSRSPSCALRDAKRFAGPEDQRTLGRGPGLFAQALLREFPGLAFEDEARLAGPARREHFLARLFTLAAFRKIKERPSLKNLTRFHNEYAPRLAAHSQKETRLLEKIAASAGAKPAKLIPLYETHLHRALARPVRRKSGGNAGRTFPPPYPGELMEL